MNIIYGRSGSGKSEYIYNKIKEDIDICEKTYIITPEQFSFTAEQKLLEKMENGATTKVEVISFERMAYRVIKELFGEKKQNLLKSGKSMIISELLDENQKKFNFLGKNPENTDLILTQITEFKKHNISVEILKKQIENVTDNLLKLKLQDMLLIYENYEEKIGLDYIDENDILTLLAENLVKSKLFDGAIFYIDEFAGFTKQEYKVIEAITKIAKKLFITVCTDDLTILKKPESDIFYDNKQTIQTLKTIEDIEQEIYLSVPYRFKSKELIHMEKNIFSLPYSSYENAVNDIELTMCKNLYEEAEYIARNIAMLIRSGYRYRDIGIITKNLDSYSSLIKAIFKKYEIPIFIDEKKDITGNSFIKYVLAVLEIFSKNWSYEAVFNYLKAGIVKIDNLYELENYALKWNIRGKKWYEEKWNFGENNAFIAEQEKIVTPLLELKKSLSGIKTAEKISQNLYEFIIKNTIDADIDAEIYNMVIDVLDEIAYLFKDKKMSFDTYAKLLKTGIGAKEIGQIPQTQDKVTVGDVNRSKTHKLRAIFIIGLNDGQFPATMSSEGFFSDRDREILKEKGASLAKGTIEKMYEENFNIYKAFSAAEEKIYISYPMSDIDDKPLRKSTMISKIKKIFPKLKEETCKAQEEILTKEVTFDSLLAKINDISENWYEVYEWYKKDDKWSLKLEKALEGLDYTNVPENISKENLQRLYGNTLHTTVSRLEQYKACSFSYYLKYGLKLSDKEKMDIKPVDTGSFMHEVIDAFFKNVENIKDIQEEDIKKNVDKIVEEKMNLPKNYIFNATAKYRILVQRLKKVIFMSLKYIVQSLKDSEFNVLETELEFGDNKYPPIEMNLDNGKRVSITGKIDRVDIAKTNDGKYIRIIDYKSSAKDIELNKVVSGLQLQLLTYVDAITSSKEVMPAGALYFTLLEPKLLGEKELSKEEIEEIIKKNYKMNGLVLADVNVIKMMDKNLENGKSDIIPVSLNNSGEINYKSSKTVTREEFEALQKYTVKLIKDISKEILNGKMELKPYYITSEKKTPCSYCEYKSICRFNPREEGNNYLYIGNKSRQDVLEQILEEEDK